MKYDLSTNEKSKFLVVKKLLLSTLSNYSVDEVHNPSLIASKLPSFMIQFSATGSMFLPPTTSLGAGLYSISIYGGLVLFSMFLLYDTQKVIKRAENHPIYSAQKFDPINS